MNGTLTAAWIQGLCTAVPTTFAAAVAYKALSSWRADALGRRRVLLAEECLKQVWDLAWRIESLRRPLWAGAWISRDKESPPTPEELRGREQCAKLISDQFDSYEKAVSEFRATFKLISYYRRQTLRVPFRCMDSPPFPDMMYDLGEKMSMIGVELKLAFKVAYIPDSIIGQFYSDEWKTPGEAWHYFHGIPKYSNLAKTQNGPTERIRNCVKKVERSLRSLLRKRGVRQKFLDTLEDRIHDSAFD